MLLLNFGSENYRGRIDLHKYGQLKRAVFLTMLSASGTLDLVIRKPEGAGVVCYLREGPQGTYIFPPPNSFLTYDNVLEIRCYIVYCELSFYLEFENSSCVIRLI